MIRSVKAAGFVKLADGRFFHPETGAYGRMLKRSFRVCRTSASIPADRRHTIRRSKNRSCKSNLEEIWEVSPGEGMAKLLRELARTATPKITDNADGNLIEKMGDLLRCAGINHAGRNRARGGVGRSRPSLKLLLGFAPASFRADSRVK